MLSLFKRKKHLWADAVYRSWKLKSLHQALRVIAKTKDAVDRHFLLMGIVAEAYKRRDEPEMSSILSHVAEMHLGEFASIKPALIKELGSLPQVPTFQKYATFLTENAEYERAVEVCQQAIDHGLHDGTKSGYEGRIARIRKKAGTKS